LEQPKQRGPEVRKEVPGGKGPNTPKKKEIARRIEIVQPMILKMGTLPEGDWRQKKKKKNT